MYTTPEITDPIPNNCLNETSKIKNLENRVAANNRNKCERSRK